MGKHGPCCHCGVTNTPLWRNGPADKPILCNACGSRWRTKGSLANYTPLHARAEPEDYEVNKLPRAKTISINKHKETKLFKRKQFLETDGRSPGGSFCDNPSFSNFLDQDASNRSSSGSAISKSESCGQFSKVDASELTDPDKSVVWDSVVTPKKKIGIPRSKASPVQKLARELCTILHEQPSYFSGSSEEDLLFDTSTTMMSGETGHGSVLIKDPRAIRQEEESEASSLTFDTKQFPGQPSYLFPNNLLANTKSKDLETYISGVQKISKLTESEMHQEKINRSRLQNEKLQILGNHNSPLCTIDLKDIINFKEFTTRLTSEERHNLMKYLPLTDTSGCPDSLLSLFDSACFMANVSSFQQLLVEGVFDISLSGVNTEDCKTLRRFALSNLTKSKWVEHYNHLKKSKDSLTSYLAPGMLNGVPTSKISHVKRPRDESNTDVPDAASIMKCPKRVSIKDIDENKAPLKETPSCYDTISLFNMPSNKSSHATDTFQYDDDDDDDSPGQDLLLDVTLNNSFPQAELLPPSTTYQALLSSSCNNSAADTNLLRH